VKTGSGVETLGKFNEKIIAVKQGNIIATSFHPELTKDTKIHRHFIQMVKDAKS
jgi:5'-phosphate synthase pdxT subunit